jgi:hypothetical protein
MIVNVDSSLIPMHSLFLFLFEFEGTENLEAGDGALLLTNGRLT